MIRHRVGSRVAHVNVAITGDLTHTGSNVGFYNKAVAAQPGAYTQDFSTADKTHAADGSDDVTTTDPVDIPAGGTGAAQGGWDTSANRDAAIDRINLAWDVIIEQKTDFNNLRATVDDLKRLINSVIDDLQDLGLVQ